MKNKIALFLLALFSATAAGCYRQSSSAEEEEAADADLSSVYAALCRYWERCGPDRLAFFPDADVSQCIAFYDCYYRDFSPNSSVISDAAACERYIETASCDDLPEAITPLPSYGGTLLAQAAAASASAGLEPSSLFYLPFDGEALSSVAACESSLSQGDSEKQHGSGEVCLVTPYICESDLYCSVSEPYRLAGDYYCGVCAARAEEGDACGDTTPCDWGLACTEGSCAASATLGESCVEDSDCYNSSCLAAVCTERGELGAVCDTDNDCTSGNKCGADGSCIEEYTYIALTEGEPCDLSSDESVIAYCDTGLALSCIDGYCEEMSDVGGPCASDYDCRLGLNCNGATCEQYACTTAKAGDRCGLWGPRCASGAYCDTANKSCVSYLQEGDLCEDKGVCEIGLRCRATISGEPVVCANPLANGSVCSDQFDCESGYCDRPDKECEVVAGDRTLCEAPECTNCGVCMERPDVSFCE